jgi:hypothetical protein
MMTANLALSAWQKITADEESQALQTSFYPKLLAIIFKRRNVSTPFFHLKLQSRMKAHISVKLNLDRVKEIVADEYLSALVDPLKIQTFLKSSHYSRIKRTFFSCINVDWTLVDENAIEPFRNLYFQAAVSFVLKFGGLHYEWDSNTNLFWYQKTRISIQNMANRLGRE